VLEAREVEGVHLEEEVRHEEGLARLEEVDLRRGDGVGIGVEGEVAFREGVGPGEEDSRGVVVGSVVGVVDDSKKGVGRGGTFSRN